MANHRRLRRQAKRMVLQSRLKSDFRAPATIVANFARGLMKGILASGRDLLDKARIVTAGFAFDERVIRDDIGGLAGALPILPAEYPDIGGPFLAVVMNLAKPAALVNLGHGQRRHHGRAHALLRMDARMGGSTDNF